MLIFDSHLDLAMNALEWNRDLTQPIHAIRARELALTDKPDRGRGTVSFPEMRRGGAGICVATQIARFVKPTNPLPGWNSPALVPHSRQLTDEQIQCLIRRGAVIGCALDNWMLVPDWIRGLSTPTGAGVKLEDLVDPIDHICQLAGNARHAGIGSDLDGGYGGEQSPADLDTIADLARLPALFKARGYEDGDIQRIMHGNFLRFLKEAWS